MSVVVIVNLPGVTEAKLREVDAANPDLRAKLFELLKKHGSIGHRRVIGENEAMDIDEWESLEGFEAFKEEAGDVIAELARLRGAPMPTDSIWRPLN